MSISSPDGLVHGHQLGAVGGKCGQKRLENFMVPKSIVVVASLPMTDTGKLKKTALS